MWFCPRCGEKNEETFKHCWKCLSDATQPAGPSETLPPSEPIREVRPLGAVLLRVAVGFGVGLLIGMITFHRNGTSLEEAAIAGSVAGAVVAGMVGIYLWVLFPYKPLPRSETSEELEDA